jgi:hypothetical protein
VLALGPGATERRTAVRTGIAQYAGVTFFIAEYDEIDAERSDFYRLVIAQILTANDWVPKVNIHNIPLVSI